MKNTENEGLESIVLYRGLHTGTNQEIVFDYITDSKIVRLSTAYADGKPYEFDIGNDFEVVHLRW